VIKQEKRYRLNNTTKRDVSKTGGVALGGASLGLLDLVGALAIIASSGRCMNMPPDKTGTPYYGDWFGSDFGSIGETCCLDLFSLT
jgi:hypothetical protein